MAKFKTEDDALNRKEDKTVRCPVCKTAMSSMPVNIYLKDGRVMTVCYVNKCLKCGGVDSFFTFVQGHPNYECKGANVPEGLSLMQIKMYLWKGNRSTNIDYEDVIKA